MSQPEHGSIMWSMRMGIGVMRATYELRPSKRSADLLLAAKVLENYADGIVATRKRWRKKRYDEKERRQPEGHERGER